MLLTVVIELKKYTRNCVDIGNYEETKDRPWLDNPIWTPWDEIPTWEERDRVPDSQRVVWVRVHVMNQPI